MMCMRPDDEGCAVGDLEPPGPSGVSAGEMAAGAVALLGLVAADVATGGLLSVLNSIPAGRSEEPFVAVDLSGTAPPRVAADGTAPCSRCGARVTFSSMSINERGYFCAACAADQS